MLRTNVETIRAASAEPVDDASTTHVAVFLSPGESTAESVAHILRADKQLTPEDVDMLMTAFRAVYDGLLRRNGRPVRVGAGKQLVVGS